MNKALLLVAFALSVSTIRAAGETYETSAADYGQTTATTTMDLIWSFTLNSSGGTTHAVITGVKNANGTANPSGALTVPTSVIKPGTGAGYIVKKIDDGAFANQIGLTSISIPVTIQEIGTGAFVGCTVLSEISVTANSPWFTSVDGVLYDKDRATLIACPATIEVLSLPSSLTSLDPTACANCHRLTSVIIPASVATIGSRAFTGCTLLESLTFNGHAPTADATICDNPEDITIYKESTSTGWDVAPWTSFKDIRNTTAEASSKVQHDESGNLTWYYRIKNDGAELYNNGDAVIPTGTAQSYTYDTENKKWVGDGLLILPTTLGGHPVTRIGKSAFRNCASLTKIVIPSSVKVIEDYAFEGCLSIEEITLPPTLTELGVSPFTGTWITSLALPAKLTTLHGNPVAGCENLDSLTVDAKNRNFIAVDNVLYNRKQTRLYGVQTFVEKLTVPASVAWIATNAFSSCSLLTSVTYEGSAPALEDDGYSLYKDTDKALVSHTTAGTKGWDGSPSSTNMPEGAQWPLVGPNRRTFESKPSASGVDPSSSGLSETDGSGYSWTYSIDGGKLALGAYGETPVIPNTTSGEISVPEKLANRTVTEIPELAFAGCGRLTKITIPAGVTNIAATAFNGCTSLVEIAVSAENPTFASKYRCLYSKDGKTIVRVPAATRFAATQTQTTIGQKKDVIEILGTIEESTGLLQPNTIITKKTYGKSTDTLVYTFTPALSAEHILAGVTRIADYAFSDCGRIDEGTTVSGTLSTKKNGSLDNKQVGTFSLPFTTDADHSAESTNVLSSAAGFYQEKVCFYRTATFGTTTYTTDVPLVIPATVTSVSASAFDNAHFTSVSHNVPKFTGSLALTRLGGTSNVYGPLTPGVSVSLDMADFAGCTASGLPTGLKWTKATGVLAGIPTKPGTYEVTFKQTVKENGRNKTVSRTATIRVADYPVMTLSAAWENAFTGETEALAAGHRLSFYVGVSQQFALTVANDLAEAQNTIMAKGLPAGLKLVKTALKNEKKVVTNYVYTISGTPTKAQTSKTVTLTVSNKYKWSGSLALEIEILALPAWVTGSYNGVRYDTSSNAFGAASATLSTVGKLSGKFLVPSDDLKNGKTYSISSASLTAFDPETETFLGTATMKIGKLSHELPFSLVQAADGTGYLELEMPDGHAALVQNVWNRADLAAPTYAKGAKITVDGITFKPNAKGVVSWSGKIEGDNGKPLSVSGTAQLLNGSDLLLYIPPRANLLGGVCELVTLP